MKKVLGLLAAAAVLSSGVAFAQDTDSHDVEIRIPDVLRIRLTAGNSTNAVADPTPVQFDFVAQEALFDVGTIFGPTNTTPFNWDDVQVFSNAQNGWEVSVATSNATFAWNKVTVEPGVITGKPNNANVDDVFNLGSGRIADSTAKTGGWERLGFGPEDFSIQFDGSEDAGDYSTTVTYSITSL